MKPKNEVIKQFTGSRIEFNSFMGPGVITTHLPLWSNYFVLNALKGLQWHANVFSIEIMLQLFALSVAKVSFFGLLCVCGLYGPSVMFEESKVGIIKQRTEHKKGFGIWINVKYFSLAVALTNRVCDSIASHHDKL